jgi:uncharacterized protein
MMTKQAVLDLDPLLLDLFAEMRSKDMCLTLDDYGLLRQSLAKSFGLGGWDDLREVCECLWVKPSYHYSQENFNRAFDCFQRRYEGQLTDLIESEPAEEDARGRLPKIPPRLTPTLESSPLTQQTIKAIKVGSPSVRAGRKKAKRIYETTRYPVNLREVQTLWRMMRQWIRFGYDLELDLDGTIAKIQTEGWWSDVVFRPISIHKMELVILVDDSTAMRPFQWALQPFISAAECGSVSPIRLYRFSKHPQDNLYLFGNRRQAVPFSEMLTHCHHDRTILLIWSEAGAALNQMDWSYINGVEGFLLSVAPCIRQVFWLNPLPKERWTDNSAEWIQGLVNDKMFSLCPTIGSAFAKARWSEPVSRL